MRDNEILEMALRFIENAVISRTFDQASHTESFRAFRNGYDISVWNKASERVLLIDGILIRNSDTADKVFAAMKKHWMDSGETDETRLAKFRDMTRGLKIEPMSRSPREHENERGGRERK